MEVETKEYYRGYLNSNGSFTKLIKENDKFKVLVFSKSHMYDVITYTKCYDVNGVFLGEFEQKKFEHREEFRIKEDYDNVFQINYEFHLLPLGRCSTQDEVSYCRKNIKTYFNTKELKHDPTSKIYNEIFLKTFLEIEDDILFKNYYNEQFQAYEISATGHSVNIYNMTNKRLYDLDIKEYTKRKNEFIKKHPSYKDTVEYIYNLNIGYLMLFWNVSKKQLLRDNFNKSNKAIDKLNRRITKSIINK